MATDKPQDEPLNLIMADMANDEADDEEIVDDESDDEVDDEEGDDDDEEGDDDDLEDDDEEDQPAAGSAQKSSVKEPAKSAESDRVVELEAKLAELAWAEDLARQVEINPGLAVAIGDAYKAAIQSPDISPAVAGTEAPLIQLMGEPDDYDEDVLSVAQQANSIIIEMDRRMRILEAALMQTTEKQKGQVRQSYAQAYKDQFTKQTGQQPQSNFERVFTTEFSALSRIYSPEDAARRAYAVIAADQLAMSTKASNGQRRESVKRNGMRPTANAGGNPRKKLASRTDQVNKIVEELGFRF